MLPVGVAELAAAEKKICTKKFNVNDNVYNDRVC